MSTPSSFAPTSGLVTTWYRVPARVTERAKKLGFQRCPSEIALRPQTGGDIEMALAGDMKAGLSFRQKMIQNCIAGVNYDPEGKEGERKPANRAGHPDYFPANIYAALPSAVATLLDKAFSEMNEAEDVDQADFLQSRSVVTS